MAGFSEAPMGEAPALSYQDILARDSRPAPELLKSVSRDLGTEPIAASRYTSAEFFKREVEKVWLKTWQFACLEDEIPTPGDTFVYELLDRSLLIVRQQNGAIKAFKNVCLHRGRKLVGTSGCRDQFRCPFHGFTWGIDGSFRENLFAWDFPQLGKSEMQLHEIRVDTWSGFIFINFDPSAEPLQNVLAPMPEHFTHWRIDDCYKAAHVGKVIPANWKACAEAFLESHHVIATHPQFDAFTGHDYSQCDVLSDHVTRFLTATAVSPGTYKEPIDEARRFAMMMSANARSAGAGTQTPRLPEGMTARAYSAQLLRTGLAQRTGYNFDDVSDAELLDGMAYDFFPNFHLWGGFKDKISYRFRPWGMNHEQTLMEVMLFAIAPKGAAKPAPCKLRMLEAGEAWAGATELGSLASVFDQDESNLGPQQEGLRTLADGAIQFSEYLEVRCRNLHRMVDVYMAR